LPQLHECRDRPSSRQRRSCPARRMSGKPPSIRTGSPGKARRRECRQNPRAGTERAS
jgi:hypothetical protein